MSSGRALYDYGFPEGITDETKLRLSSVDMKNSELVE